MAQNGHQSAREGRRSVFQGRRGPNPCQALKKRLRRFLGRPAGLPCAESVLNPEKGQRFQRAGPTHRPHAGTAGEREKGAFRARHPSPRPSRPGGKGASRPLSSGVQPAGRFASLTAPQTRGLGRSKGIKGRACGPEILTRSVLALRAALRVRLPVSPLTPFPLENRAAQTQAGVITRHRAGRAVWLEVVSRARSGPGWLVRPAAQRGHGPAGANP